MKTGADWKTGFCRRSSALSFVIQQIKKESDMREEWQCSSGPYTHTRIGGEGTTRNIHWEVIGICIVLTQLWQRMSCGSIAKATHWPDFPYYPFMCTHTAADENQRGLETRVTRISGQVLSILRSPFHLALMMKIGSDGWSEIIIMCVRNSQPMPFIIIYMLESHSVFVFIDVHSASMWSLLLALTGRHWHWLLA